MGRRPIFDRLRVLLLRHILDHDCGQVVVREDGDGYQSRPSHHRYPDLPGRLGHRHAGHPAEHGQPRDSRLGENIWPHDRPYRHLLRLLEVRAPHDFPEGIEVCRVDAHPLSGVVLLCLLRGDSALRRVVHGVGGSHRRRSDGHLPLQRRAQWQGEVHQRLLHHSVLRRLGHADPRTHLRGDLEGSRHLHRGVGLQVGGHLQPRRAVRRRESLGRVGDGEPLGGERVWLGPLQLRKGIWAHQAGHAHHHHLDIFLLGGERLLLHQLQPQNLPRSGAPRGEDPPQGEKSIGG
mmetsp:Transcript_93685/g.201009  ORF Transcript_93685/g.201009 Transcript_93685/m.201009 type:complete len:291 (+) Transcript_93685:1032-1904(+)